MTYEYPVLPTYIKAALDGYARCRYQPGGFLMAVLENNLMEALGRADDFNSQRAVLRDITWYVFNELPDTCWGSPEKVAAWLASDELTPYQKEARTHARSQ